ncbi:hypothetical protein [Streptomyces laculatispora]|uniref:hypothetical protein n=1 Tax=Streptomyces laculatispora TaxID=887464 RepID=UPI001A943CE7|nr:hypothetical protein [Streptomyces laculatispora]MBO0918614.1 hypothetical protein [Streptomyces laculatispora]
MSGTGPGNDESPQLLLHRRDGEDLVLTTAVRAEQDRSVVSAATRMLAAMAYGQVPDPRELA